MDEPPEGGSPTAMEGVASDPPPADDAGDALSGEYTWNIPNFGDAAGDEKLFSDTFTVGSHPWNLLLFPKGNKVDALSAYVNAADAGEAGDGWRRAASFTLTLVHPTDPSRSLPKDAAHAFQASAVDWGFTQFVPLAAVRAGGFVDAAGGITIHARLRVDPAAGAGGGDCRKETGCVGLKNQGATCYMNSLLQTLYHINAFRRAVYHMPTSPDDEPHECMPLALQSLFFKLQFGPGAAPTRDLTRSFGWDHADAFMQHDVQELNRVLCEKLEAKMKGTAVDGTIARLFEGHTHNFVECINVDGVSTRTESFMDLQLDVKGCKDVHASFDAYTAVETLAGANQYKHDDHGLQDARKGVLFDSFPPVLQLQLKRFEYDFARDTMVKINDRYEFPEELDLDAGAGKYLSKAADRSVRNLYRLHSVLVHSGGVHGGHYYAFTRPDGSRWLRFDDERVTREDAAAAVADQYGGSGNGGHGGGGVRVAKFSNAYMLVYVRASDWDTIMAPVAETDVHVHVRDRLRAEVADKERRRREKAEAHLHTVVRAATDADVAASLAGGRHFDLVDHDALPAAGCVRVRKKAPVAEAKAALADALGAPPDRQRWWLWARRQNGTYRPTRALGAADDAVPMGDIELAAASRAGALDVFVETAADGAALPSLVEGDPILLFFKRYDPEGGALTYEGHRLVPRGTRVADLAADLAPLVGPAAAAAPPELWEEIKYEPNVMVDALAPESTLGDCQLENGDVIVFQPAASTPAAAGARHPTASAFMEWLRARRLVTFKPLDDPRSDGVSVELAADDSYDTVAAAAADAVGAKDDAGAVNGDWVRLTQHNVYAGGPKPAPVRHRGAATLDALLTHCHSPSDTLYVEALSMPLPALELLKPLRVEWLPRGAPPATHTLMLARDATVADALADLAAAVGESAAGQPLRLLEIFYARIYKVFAPADRVDAINDSYWTLRAEPVPEGDAEPLAENERYLHVCHCAPDAGGGAPTTHGDPFMLRVRDEETLDELKPRIRAALRQAVTDKEFGAWKFALCPHLRPPEYLQGTDAVGARLGRQAREPSQGPDPTYLGLEHAATGARGRRRPGGGGLEKAIKIQ